MRRKRKNRAELIWWLGVVVWAIALVLWHPDADVSYLEAPSLSAKPPHFGIFHQLVKGQTIGTVRMLSLSDDLLAQVGVVVLLAPTQPVPVDHREQLLEWVDQSGGTLVLGYPIFKNPYEQLSAFSSEIETLSRWQALATPQTSVLYCVLDEANSGRDVPPFRHTVSGVMEADEGRVWLEDEERNVIGTIEPYGSGQVVQLAMADILDNDSLGRKRTHLFAATLLDVLGRGTKWGFVEAYEGIESTPAFIKLVGSSRARALFLQVLLLLWLGYWWRTKRLGALRRYVGQRDVRDVASQARDTGEFYFRAGKSRWALSCCLDYLKLMLKGRHVSGETKSRALKLVDAGTTELKRGRDDMEKHALMIKKIALSQQELVESIKGSKR